MVMERGGRASMLIVPAAEDPLGEMTENAEDEVAVAGLLVGPVNVN